MIMTDTSNLLFSLQKGIPLCEHPFQSIAEEEGLSEQAVVDQIQTCIAKGTARRFGAVFDSHSLGYASTLCALDIDVSGLSDKLQPLMDHPGVTHCYQRAIEPALWFTMTAQAGQLDDELEKLKQHFYPAELFNLPALRRFKIGVILNTTGKDLPRSQPANPPERKTTVSPLSQKEKQLIRVMQHSFPLTVDLFSKLAEQTDYTLNDLLILLRDWQSRGIIRRVGLILNHRKAGFRANAMCVWKVCEEDMLEKAVIIASHPVVTHCYERSAFSLFPYNLYAMIHAPTKDKALEIFKELSADINDVYGHIAFTVKEFKKTSPVFFYEDQHES